MSINISFGSTAEYVNYIGEQYLIAINKQYYIERMKQVIDFYNITNMFSETSAVWNYYSQNWDVILKKETTNINWYLKELKKLGRNNSHIKKKINEIELIGPHKPILYVFRTNYYDNLGINELNEQKEKVNSQMNYAIYNYYYEKYISYNEHYLYISKLIDKHNYNLMIQKEIETTFLTQPHSEYQPHLEYQPQTEYQSETESQAQDL
jgi:hypothetical protein